ncbi:methyl-accepting chemotaxis protein [Novosphingobium beihaiensis]|uniref:methyl-accepting chemotaxis protein n=1 Tax=Novosphingobium beihaiensis TaxID=2930389 RepID=UPI002E1162A7
MIKHQTRIGSRVLSALVLLAMLATAFVIIEIRFGGPIQRKHALNDEMLADILPPPAFVVEPYLEASLAAANPETGQADLERIHEIQTEFNQRKAYWASAPVPEEMRAQLNSTIAVADEFFAAIDSQLAPAIASGSRDRIDTVLNRDLTPLYQRQREEVIKLVGLSRTFNQREMASDNRMVAILLGFSAMAALIVAGSIQAATVFIRRRIVTPLDEASHTIESLASGDYQVSVDGLSRQDEFGAMARAMEVFREAGMAREEARVNQKRVVDVLSIGLDKLASKDLEYCIDDEFPEGYEALRRNYNAALESFAKAMGTVRAGTSSVMSSISEIRSAADDLAQRNERQAASLEETAAAMRQVTGRVNESAASTARAEETISHAQSHAGEGGEVVRRAVEAMAAIESSAQEIATIVDVIDGIAFQTNLLALNAGVEAARAGDAGKGFAVVANEVRELAQRSANAARDIKELITKSSGQVSAGVGLVGQTGGKFDEIVSRIDALHGLITDMAESARQQAGDLQQVSNAVDDMDRMTQQNAAMVEETTAATRSLETEASALTRMMSAFRTRLRQSRPDIAGDTNALRRTSIAGEAVGAPAMLGAAA